MKAAKGDEHNFENWSLEGLDVLTKKGYMIRFVIFFITCINLSCKSQTSTAYTPEIFSGTSAYQAAKYIASDKLSLLDDKLKEDKSIVNVEESKFGLSLLAWSAMIQKEPAVKKLLSYHADPNKFSQIAKGTPFLLACSDISNSKKGVLILKDMILFGANVNGSPKDEKNSFYGEPVKLICAFGSLEALKLLVDSGAQLKLELKNEHSLFTIALLREKLDIVYYLLIEKKIEIPEYCVIRGKGSKNERKMTMTDLLIEDNYQGNQSMVLLKKQILDYLKSIGKR